MPTSPDPLVDAVRALTSLPGVPDRVAAVRAAATDLRWHEALRRRIPEAAAESRVRGAWASAALEGAELPVDLVREVVCGVGPLGFGDRDPLEQVVLRAVRATAESEVVGAFVQSAPLQALARLHTAATGATLPADVVGRPRQRGEDSRELVDLGPAVAADEVPARLRGVADLVALLASHPDLPVPVVAALVHAEIATVRPFVAGNGIAARAFERALVRSAGLDPTGVAVPEAGHRVGAGAYLGGLAAYGAGTAQGVGLWIEQWATAFEAGVAEGVAVADAVRAGRLSGSR